MTVQINDFVQCENKDYEVVSFSDPLSFSPVEYGITPKGFSTICFRGYMCEYLISNEEIVLKNFYINCENDVYPEINGVVPVIEKDYVLFKGYHYYEGVNIKISYTGKILVGKDLISKYIVPCKFQEGFVYRKLYEVVFDKGIRVDVKDRSKEAKKLRKTIEENQNINWCNLPRITDWY